MPKPTTIDANKKKKFLSLLREGVYIETAAQSVGWPKTNVFRWLEQGRRGNLENDPKITLRLQREFAAETDEALAFAESQLISHIQDCAKGKGGMKDWRAAAWMLEKRFRSRWAPKVESETQVTEIVVDIGGK